MNEEGASDVEHGMDLAERAGGKRGRGREVVLADLTIGSLNYGQWWGT